MDYNLRKKKNTCHVEAISSSIRTEEPGNYLFKIESFSLLLEALTKTERDSCDSCHFEAGGYKWKLSLYPDGDDKRGGEGYISLYLVLADPKSLLQGEEVHVFFKFFVFDCLLDAYLVLQDGKDRRFHGFNTEWCFAKLLPLEIFKDPCQGYLVNDRCAFGVEMFFHKNEGKRGLSLFVKNNVKTHQSSFTWKIDKFSTLPEVYKSDVFNAGGHEWFLRLHPKGDYLATGECLSLYLLPNDQSSLPYGWTMYAEWGLSMLDQLNQKHYEKTDFFGAGTSAGWGYREFMPLSDLKSESRGFIVEDTAVVVVIFKRIYSIDILP